MTGNTVTVSEDAFDKIGSDVVAEVNAIGKEELPVEFQTANTLLALLVVAKLGKKLFHPEQEDKK